MSDGPTHARRVPTTDEELALWMKCVASAAESGSAEDLEKALARCQELAKPHPHRCFFLLRIAPHSFTPLPMVGGGLYSERWPTDQIGGLLWVVAWETTGKTYQEAHDNMMATIRGGRVAGLTQLAKRLGLVQMTEVKS